MHQVGKPVSVADPATADGLPRLRHCTLIETSEQGPITLVVGRIRYALDIQDASRASFLNLKRYLDGRHSVSEIAQASGIYATDVEEAIEALRAAGLLRSESETPTIPIGPFIAQLQATCEMWSRQIGLHRLFASLSAGTARKELFLGLLLETRHLVAATAQHALLAAEHATNSTWTKLLAQYSDEERGHERFFDRALINLGLREEWIETAHPIIATMSLINLLREVARSDALAYFAAMLLLEAPESVADLRASSASLLQIGKQYGLAHEVLLPIIRHAELDQNAAHRALIARALNGTPHVSMERAHAVVNVLHDLKHSFDQLHDGIVQYYNDISNYIPRLKVDYFSL